MLLDRHREVGAALDRGVVGDDHAGRALDPADAGDDPSARRLVLVHPAGRERAELQERGPGVEQPVDSLADGQLPALPVTGDRGARRRRHRGPPRRPGEPGARPRAPSSPRRSSERPGSLDRAGCGGWA